MTFLSSFFRAGPGPNLKGKKLMRDDAVKHQIVKSRGQPQFETSLTLQEVWDLNEGFVWICSFNG